MTAYGSLIRLSFQPDLLFFDGAFLPGSGMGQNEELFLLPPGSAFLKRIMFRKFNPQNVFPIPQ